MPQKINVRHRAQQTGHLIPSHWGTNRSRKSRGWTNELSCENYIPLNPAIQRTDAQGQTYTVPGLCKIGADHIIYGLPVYHPTAKCDKIIEAPPQDGS